MRLWVLLPLLAFPLLLPAQEREGYRLSRTQVQVDRPWHWEAWEAAIGSRDIEADAAVRPRFMRRDINAMLNATTFETIAANEDTIIGGIREAGSSPETAEQVMDGSADTWWEPDREDDLDSWFLEIDLGRSVIAQRVVVRFAEEGDPFLKFRVLLSDGRTGRGRHRGLTFFRAGQVTWRNKDQRLFSFEIKPQRPQPEGMSGEVAQLVRVEVLDTDGPRGEEVDDGTYQGLSAEDKGAVDYFRQTVSGRQILIDEETYRELPEQEQGEVRYYRYERPRLAEIEVHALGDNLVTLTQRLRNRDLSLIQNLQRVLTTDGFFRSAYFLRPYDPLRDKNQLTVDLGAKFWVDRIRLLSMEAPPSAYQVRISDGRLDPTGVLIWQAFEERLNRESFLQQEERFPLQQVRFIELRCLELLGSANEKGDLSEIQAYGEGYVAEVALTSPIIRLERPRIFTSVNWKGEAPPEARIEIRTRSGDQLLQVAEYYDVRNRAVSQEEWESLPEPNRGERIVREIPGPDWSDWSEVYRTSGEHFRSPSPRRYAQLQIELLTRNPLRAAVIRNLSLDLAPPLVDQSFAEIWPVQGVPPGVDREFTLYIQPHFRTGNSGFDRIRLHSSSSAPIELVSMRAGRDQQLRFGGARQLWPGEVGARAADGGGVELIFPEPVTRGGLVYEVKFRTRVFLSGTTFTAELTHATRPEVVQKVSQGDATSLAQSQSLSVISDLRDAPLLDVVRIEPASFTPNGDGINDETQIRFSIFRLKGEHLLGVEVYDLNGRRVRDLSMRRTQPSGEHAFLWDGLTEEGRLVRPGIYLVRIQFATDADVGGSKAVRVIHVVY